MILLPVSLIPSDEEARLQALAPFRAFQMLPDVVFEAFVELVALLFNVPVAMLSFVDADSVWLKALYGLSEPRRVPRHQSLCSITILQEETTVVHNLAEATLPVPISDLLNEMLHLCFYAGHPLQTPQGYSIGVLGIAARTARDFDHAQQQHLRSLAALAMQLLQLRLAFPYDKQNPSAVWAFFYDELLQFSAYFQQPRHDAADTPPPGADEIIGRLQRSINRISATIRPPGSPL